MNAKQYIDYGKKQGFLSDQTLTDVGYVSGTDINWADEVFEPTWNYRHTVGVQGAADKGSYFVAMNYVYNDGIFAGDKDVYERLSTQINGEYKVKSWLTVGTNNNIEKWETKSVSQQSDNGSALLAAVTSDPLFGPVANSEAELNQRQKDALAAGIAVLKDKNGEYYRLSPISGESQSANPFIQRDRAIGGSDGINVRGLAYANFNPIEGLVYTSRLGYRLAQGNTHNYEFPFAANEFVSSSVYRISANANVSYYYQFAQDGTQTYGSVPNGLPNPDLEWEESEQVDLGLDARFINGKLSLGVDRPTNAESQEAVMQWVADEIDLAPPHLEERESPSDYEGAVKITKGFALAVKGKALLWKRDYAGARDALKQVINSGKYELLPFPKRAVDLNSGLKQNPNWD